MVRVLLQNDGIRARLGKRARVTPFIKLDFELRRIHAMQARRSSTTISPSLVKPPGQGQPVPEGHARVLVRVYGQHRAFRIAQRNARLTSPETYWSDVLDAVLELEPRH